MDSRLRLRWPRVTFAVVALAIALLLVAPFTHHDLQCHIKTPLHCTACASGLLSPDPRAHAIVGAPTLADAGSAPAALPSLRELLLTVRLTGRSPPSHV
jgi:hypothetical protein